MVDGTSEAWEPDTPETIAARPGEELDVAVVAAYLRPRLLHAEGALTIRQFTGGLEAAPMPGVPGFLTRAEVV